MVLTLVFSGAVLVIEYRARSGAIEQIDEHARIIADDLWNFNHTGAVEYLKLAARTDHYQQFSIVRNNGRVFEEVTSDILSPWEKLGIRLRFVHRVSLVSAISYSNNHIGWVEAVWVPQTLSTHLIVLVFLSLIWIVSLLYQRVIIERNLLERRVHERTKDLFQEKIKAEDISKNLTIVGAEFQALLDNSPVGILFVGYDRVIRRVNLEITRITGYSQEELIGKTTEILYASKEIYEAQGEENYPELKRHGFCTENSEIVRKDGKIAICYWRGKVISDTDGLSGVVWTLEDISVRLKMEDELLKVKKLESIGVLAGGIAHDFNNLLLAILGNISLAVNLTKGDEKVQDLLSTAEKASLRAKDLTVKLLTFASGGDPVKISESLPELLEESASFVLSGSNVKCVYDFAEDLWAVKMDRGQISQVIQNLVLNADQSMPEGGTLNISCDNIVDGSIVPGLLEGRYVRVRVTDSGVGIALENIEKIFDPYFSTKEKDSNKGSGLGLSIVHSIITKHEGVIKVDSCPAGGTTFSIYLPATILVPDVEDTPQKELVLAGKGRVLVMDDDKVICKVACDMLNYLGYESCQVYDGAEAIMLYREEAEAGRPFDVVIMDLTIPGGMGGEEAIKRLLEIDPQVKAIVSSGYAKGVILNNYQEYGFYNTVSKPYELKDLSRVLQEAING